MNKYIAIVVNGKKIDEHRHIMQVHLGRKLTRNEVVHHIDNNKSNNDISNLQLLSRSEHSRMHVNEMSKDESYINLCRENGRKQATRQFKKNVLNRDQVSEIKSLKGKMKQSDIAKQFNISKTTISRIFSGEMWASVQ